MPKCQKPPCHMQKRIRVGFLPFNARGVRCVIHRQIKRITIGKPEVFGIFLQLPRHRNAAAAASFASLGFVVIGIMHPNLIAIVQERYAGHCENKCISGFQLFFIPSDRNALDIMISRYKTNIPFVARKRKQILIPVRKIIYAAFSLAAEITVTGAVKRPVLFISEKREIKQMPLSYCHITMESRFKCIFRFSPLGNEHTLRIFLIKKRTDFLPQLDVLLVTGIVFYKRIRHIDTESVTTLRNPKFHDINQRFSRFETSRGIARHLPWLRRDGIAVIECRLNCEKITVILPIAFIVVTRIHMCAARFPRVGPNIAIRKFIFFRTCGLPKPIAFNGGMTRNKITNDFDSARVCRITQMTKIFNRAVSRRHLVIIRHIISRILKRTFIKRRKPNRRDPQALNIWKLFNNTGQIPNPIVIRIFERLRINLINNRIFQPFRFTHSMNPPDLNKISRQIF